MGLGTAPWLGDLRETPFSAPADARWRLTRPFLTLENAPIGQPLRTYRYGQHTPAPPAVGQKLAEIIELDTPTGAVVHPATLARQMIALLTNSYDYGHPSIHLTSHMQNFARIPAGTDVVLCGTFVDAFERNGHHNAVIDADLYSLDGQRLARQRHSQHLQGPPRPRNGLSRAPPLGEHEAGRLDGTEMERQPDQPAAAGRGAGAVHGAGGGAPLRHPPPG